MGIGTSGSLMISLTGKQNILRVGKPNGQGRDKWVWTKESNGFFSPKSAYLIQALGRAPLCSVAPSLWNKLWNSKILERHKVLWWSILSDALPIRALFSKRMVIDETSCPICGKGDETMEHLFLFCDLASHLWRSSPWGIMPVVDFGARMWNWVKFLWDLRSRGVDTDGLFLYASIVVDTIWRARNDKVHNNSLGTLVHYIDSIYYCYADYGSCLFKSHRVEDTLVWSPPPEDWIKINCDVRVGEETMCAVAIARDHQEAIFWVATNKIHFSDPFLGEAAACLLALETTISMHHPFVVVESDSAIVIKNLKGDESFWRIENYTSQCKQLFTFFTSCNFSFISRKYNFVAHNVANWAFAKNINGMVEVSTIPNAIFCNDREVQFLLLI
ncbi:uncharacterized protein LOC115717800 [Cannabis sativa]|uniref:uncharacterized protein LOC115717800 n=1 Tax=Cannabis sativa TaxID=3483 RepID=UPI0029C9FD3E|nr:uncharacterized protein LOC115717800 [Cannabis sativa]